MAHKHGVWHSKEWNSWDHMKRRCLNPKDPKYKDYGGRGIKVCERWLGRDGFSKSRRVAFEAIASYNNQTNNG